MRQYPQLEIDLSLLQSNARAVISRCNAAGICVCGVIKGADGLPEIARALRPPAPQSWAPAAWSRWPNAVPPVCPAPGS